MQRWTEIVVYLLPDGSYLLSKVGRSTIAHRPDCVRVNRWMVTWLEAEEEARVHRRPCVECMPVVGDEMDPHTVLESTRYTARQAKDSDELLALLLQGRPGDSPLALAALPALVRRIIEQVIEVDSPFATVWSRILDS